ncbi:hypothetical protein WJX81_000406 [Elliptochloris bilobata]|uniref:ARC6 IMS domain-containing protein n=1 Tax=Elliptochloris bilobata TaxID=381761 RepID=A0AAW1SFX2_9CHLO
MAPPRGVTFPIPVDYTQLLGLKGREAYLDPHILAAYEGLAAASPEEGFSERAAEGRAFLLQAAADELRRSRGRTPPGEPRGIYVEWALLPGALALLQEVGEHEVVLEVGARALDKWEARGMRPDILLAMALAHLGLASEAFEAPGHVATGCARLEAAAALLADAGAPALAPELEAEIAGALADLQPAATLEHLMLPLDEEHAATRRAALAVLRSLLARGAGGGNGAVAGAGAAPDAAFAREALARLPAPEVVQLVDWVETVGSGAPPWASPEVLQTAALAHVVTGLLQRRPSLIQVAERLLGCGPAGNGLVERVVCKVLLGAPEAAAELLLDAERRGDLRQPRGALQAQAFARQATPAASANGAFSHATRYPGPTSPPPPSAASAADGPSAVDVLRAVRADSPDGDEDLLPGLCAFTQRWLSGVAFPRFRDTADPPPAASLTDYYEDKRVTTLLGGAALLAVGAALVSTRVRGDARSAAFQEARSRQPVAAVEVPAPAQGRHRGSGSTWRLPWQHEWSAARQLHPRTAEAVIRKWQNAKAEALGPRHNIALLPQVAADPWLSRVIQDAAAAEEAGWFWHYRLDSLKVESIDASQLSPIGGSALVTARLREAGDLYAATGKRSEGHCYDNTYTVEYTLRRLPDAGWRIADALVTGTR